MLKSRVWLLALLLLPGCRAYLATPSTRVTARSQLLLRAPKPFAVSFLDAAGTRRECMVTEVRGEASLPVGDTLQFAKFAARGEAGLPTICLSGFEGRVVRPSDSNISLAKRRFSPRHTLALILPVVMFAGVLYYAWSSSFTLELF